MAGFNRFEDFELSRKLVEAVQEARFERPTELQQQVIPSAIEGQDVIFEARSGMGKSACFAIPFLQRWLRNRNEKALIIAASESSVRQLGKVISRVVPALNTRVMKFTRQDDYFYPDMLERTPIVICEMDVVERFLKREKEFAKKITMLGVDDFELLLEREEELTRIVSSLDPGRQTLVSASDLNEQVLEKGRWLCDPNRLEKVKIARPETAWEQNAIKLQYMAIPEEQKFEKLAEQVRASEGKIVMVITNSDRMSEHLADRLTSEKLPAKVLAYSMQLDAKNTVVNEVVAAGSGVMVGCDASMNGMNLPKVHHLISWDLPTQIDAYWRRVDRFADQGELIATLILDTERGGAVRVLERRLGRKMENLGPELICDTRPARDDRRDDRGGRDRRDDRGGRDRRGGGDRGGRDRRDSRGGGDRRDNRGGGGYRGGDRSRSSAPAPRREERASADDSKPGPEGLDTPENGELMETSFDNGVETVNETAPIAVAEPARRKIRPTECGEPGKPVIGDRFRSAVFAKEENVQQLAPEGVSKNLGSKFVPARKRR